MEMKQDGIVYIVKPISFKLLGFYLDFCLSFRVFCVYFIYVVMLVVARLVVTDRDVLGGLAVVLEDDRDVHVDDDEEADHQVGQQEGDRHDRVAAVALVTRLGIRCNQKYF